MGFPSDKEIEELLNSITDDDFVELLPSDASKVDRLKFELCRKFIIYIQRNAISQSDLARLLDVDRSIVNWIVKYRIKNFTIDRLYNLLSQIDPNVELKVS